MKLIYFPLIKYYHTTHKYRAGIYAEYTCDCFCLQGVFLLVAATCMAVARAYPAGEQEAAPTAVTREKVGQPLVVTREQVGQPLVAASVPQDETLGTAESAWGWGGYGRGFGGYGGYGGFGGLGGYGRGFGGGYGGWGRGFGGGYGGYGGWGRGWGYYG